MSPRILLVEDEKGLATSLTDLLEVEGFAVTAAPSLRIARDVLKRQEVTLVLLDLTLPDGSGLELLDEIGALPQGPVVVVLTADSSLTTTVESIRRGAYDYLPKPFELESLLNRVKNALNHQGALAAATLNQRLRCLEAQARPQIPLPSSAMRSLHERLNKVAQRDSLPILVRGETGAGKEHICRLVHELSPRSAEPFVALNCATLERNLLQSELFGHERGAFTGANEKRRGLFELASRGTLLLDEVAEMPLDVQASSSASSRRAVSGASAAVSSSPPRPVSSPPPIWTSRPWSRTAASVRIFSTV
jgi:two-component system response regulator AtoC